MTDQAKMPERNILDLRQALEGADFVSIDRRNALGEFDTHSIPGPVASAALDRIKAEAVREAITVKPLVWSHSWSSDWNGPIWQTTTPHYMRTIVPSNVATGFHLLASYSSNIKGDFPTLEAAKAAAQADYNGRILSAIRGEGEA